MTFKFVDETGREIATAEAEHWLEPLFVTYPKGKIVELPNPVTDQPVVQGAQTL